MSTPLIRQPNNWSCAAACACMATHTNLADFYAFVGHDGSEIVSVTKLRPLGRRCFTHKEIARYLLEHNFMYGWGCKPQLDFDPQLHILKHVDLEALPALVDVTSVNKELIHCLLWDTKRVVDPYFPERDIKLSDYELLGWWPLTKIPEDY